ncbi:MAG: hypothetical protein KGI11_08535 [Thaumarchaeota archaeon]|nr:hypothetical protein [Nitrososphaerota archaeon]
MSTLKQKEASKRWYDKNKERLSQKRKGQRGEEHRKYYLKNKEKIIEQTISWAKRNPEKVKEIQKNHRRRNPRKRLYSLIKERSLKRGLDFNLQEEDIILPQKCPYLGVEFIVGDKNYGYSVDRINNEKGYIKGNIEVICILANKMKNIASKDQLIIFAKNILRKYEEL